MRLSNPSRASQGGDVEGDTKNDQEHGLGAATTVAKASYDPGYSLKESLTDDNTSVSVADLKQGYCTYGKVIGE